MMTEVKKSKKAQAKIAITAAIESGLVDRKINMEDIMSKIGDDIDDVAGYVIAWEKYVAVIGNASELTPEIKFTR